MVQVFVSLLEAYNMLPQRNAGLNVPLCALLHAIEFYALKTSLKTGADSSTYLRLHDNKFDM